MYVLEVKNLSFAYRGEAPKALDNVSLSLPYGKILLLAGASGCGKTTLLRAITGLVPRIYAGSYSGEVLIEGKNVLSMSQKELAVNVGYVFQNPENQLVSYIVEREVAFGLENLGFEKEHIINRTESVLKELGIYELKDRPLRTLSDGQKQLVAIAGILVMDPKILILDEPTSTLDPATARMISSKVNEIIRKRGASSIVVDHRIDLFAETADYMAVMKEGRIAEFGKVSEVLENYSGKELRVPAFIEVQKTAYGRVIHSRFEDFLRELKGPKGGGLT
ncbi:MAG: ABC transporter ATP-binding protein [Nitrososphaeria archaeon]